MFKILNSDTIKIGSTVVQLPCSIGGTSQGEPRVFEYNGLIIVNFYPQSLEESHRNKDSGVDTSRNIWAFDQEGNLVWQVQSFKSWVLEKYNSQHNSSAPYTYVSVQDEKLVGGNWAGSDLIIDPKNEKILGRYPDDTPRRPW